MSSLKLDLRVGEAVSFNGGQIVVKLLEKSGQRARLDIEADESVRIDPVRRATAADAARKGLTVMAA